VASGAAEAVTRSEWPQLIEGQVENLSPTARQVFLDAMLDAFNRNITAGRVPAFEPEDGG
jgi:hypothetical protein